METSLKKAGKMLILSPFSALERRLRKDLAVMRNLFAAAVAEEVVIAYAAEGSKTAEFTGIVREWGKPILMMKD